MKNQFYIIGAGGHALVIIEIIEAAGAVVKAVYDIKVDQPEVLGIPVYALEETAPDVSARLIIAIGNNLRRRKVAREFAKNPFGIAIDPGAGISPSAGIGEGSVIMKGVSVNAMTQIGKHCILNTNASVDHECILGDFVHISPNVALCGAVRIGEGSHIGAGAVVIPGVKIGKWATIGAGSVIIKDVPNFATVVGNPGRIIKINNQ